MNFNEFIQWINLFKKIQHTDKNRYLNKFSFMVDLVYAKLSNSIYTATLAYTCHIDEGERSFCRIRKVSQRRVSTHAGWHMLVSSKFKR